MKKKLLVVIAVISIVLSSRPALAAGTTAPPLSAIDNELMPIVSAIKVKLEAGKRTEADLADNLKQLDAAIAKHKNEKTEDVAQIYLLKVSLYLQVIEDSDKAIAAANQLKIDFSGTPMSPKIDQIIAQIKAQAEADKVKNALKVGTKFPDFNEKDLAGKPLSIANYKGKVVMLDFWATWCGPCVEELPNVQAVYKKHHGEGFEIIGISLDEDRSKLDAFLKKNPVMTWQQFFDGQGWKNKVSTKYGVDSIPATYLLDGNGNIIGKDLRGPALETAVAAALAKK